jgi:hypothetical protein
MLEIILGDGVAKFVSIAETGNVNEAETSRACIAQKRELATDLDRTQNRPEAIFDVPDGVERKNRGLRRPA